MSQLPIVELIANHNETWTEYDPDQLIAISERLSAINLPAVFIDDGVIEALGIPIFLNLDIPYSKHLLSAKIELIKMYHAVFPDIVGVNFTSSMKALTAWNKLDIAREIFAITSHCEKLGLQSRYTIYSSHAVNYSLNEELASIAEQNGVAEIIYMNNSKYMKPEDSLLEAVQSSDNLSIPVSFAGRVANLDMVKRTRQIKSFILPPSNIFELFPSPK